MTNSALILFQEYHDVSVPPIQANCVKRSPELFTSHYTLTDCSSAFTVEAVKDSEIVTSFPV